MSELQALVTNWLSALVAALPVGFAFGAGMVAAVNPCGFAMLPAYLSLYLGAREEEFAKLPAGARALRALLVSVAVSSGFVLLFGAAGVVVAAGGRALLGAMPWVGLSIGVVLMVLGLWMLAGQSLYASFFQRIAGRLGIPKLATPRASSSSVSHTVQPRSAAPCRCSCSLWATGLPLAASCRPWPALWATLWGWPQLS